LAHYNWLQLHYFPAWPASPLDHPDPVDTAPFTGWVAYAPMLAMGCYLAATRALRHMGHWRWVYLVLFLLLLNNLVFSGGRTGMVAFCALALYGCVRWLRGRWLWAVFAGGLFVSAALGFAYLGGGEYRVRFDRGIAELRDPDQKINGSVSSRIIMARHTWDMIRFNPVLGVGTGDWPLYHHELNRIHTPKWRTWREPHNQYLLSWSTLGIGGLVALLLIYFPPTLFRATKPGAADGLNHLRWALPVWMGSISLFGSYLWDSHTCLVFLLFSAVAWSCAPGVSQQRFQRGPCGIQQN
jgi:O-antigen ligase